MKYMHHLAPAHFALALAFVFGAWLFPSAPMAQGPDVSPAGTGTAATGPERIQFTQAGSGADERPVSYAMDQADRGESKFERDCKECHGDDLKGGLNGGAPLRGMVFEDKYFGDLPASVLYSYMSSAMPPNSPGRFSPSTYADLMAYVLKRNGFQPGAPLPSDFEALDKLIMEK